MQGVAGYNGDALLEKIKARALFMGGSEDPAAELMHQLPDKVRNAWYVEIDGERHIANADRAGEFTRQLLQFLA